MGSVYNEVILAPFLGKAGKQKLQQEQGRVSMLREWWQDKRVNTMESP